MKIIKLSLQNFAQPSPRSGSLGLTEMSLNSAQRGIELHQKIQAEKKRKIQSYRVEVPISQSFQKGKRTFEVTGRIDGIQEGTRPRIDEIKSCFNIYELKKKIKKERFHHPYFLQLVSYGYFYWLGTQIKPSVHFELISSRRDEKLSFEVYWEVDEYERWLNRRLDDLVAESIESEKRLKRRQKLSQYLCFPFSHPRKGQSELMSFIEEGLKKQKKMLIQAPTGLGKTIGVLYPSIKEAFNRGQRVIYLTPKNSQQGVPEDALKKLEFKGHQIKSLTITSKSKICMKAEPICNPEYCEYAKDYFDKLTKYNIGKELQKKKRLTSKVFRNIAKKYEVCPFELQLESLADSDVVICDYNYVFGNDSILGKISSTGFAQEGKPNLVIDEAHNLPSRAMGNFSPSLSTSFIAELKKDIRNIPQRFMSDAYELIEMCLGVIHELAPEEEGTSFLDLSPGPFLFVNEELKNFFTAYLESDVEIQRGDVILKLVFYWGGFTDVISSIEEHQKDFFMTVKKTGEQVMLKITCCDASSLIKSRYDFFQNHVLFSATLSPFEYYLKLSGLKAEEVITREYSSPFDKKNRKVLIIPQVSTRYSEREKYYPKIAEAITKIMQVKKGNYLAFFSSFEFMDHVSKFFELLSEVVVIKQKRFMKNEEVIECLDRLKQSDRPILLLGVQGGSFSEGIDYVGEMVIGAFIVGPPLPTFNPERERMKDYYEEKHHSGVDYAYTFPAMAKAIQAAGRVIRTDTDKGIIVLMDDRFLKENYTKAFPSDWFNSSPLELVSQSILSDLSHFWKN